MSKKKWRKKKSYKKTRWNDMMKIFFLGKYTRHIKTFHCLLKNFIFNFIKALEEFVSTSQFIHEHFLYVFLSFSSFSSLSSILKYIFSTLYCIITWLMFICILYTNLDNCIVWMVLFSLFSWCFCVQNYAWKAVFDSKHYTKKFQKLIINKYICCSCVMCICSTTIV